MLKKISSTNTPVIINVPAATGTDVRKGVNLSADNFETIATATVPVTEPANDAGTVAPIATAPVNPAMPDIATLIAQGIALAMAKLQTAPVSNPVIGGTVTRIRTNLDPTLSPTNSGTGTAEWYAVIVGCDDANNGAFACADKTSGYKRALSVIDMYRAHGAKWKGNGTIRVWRGMANDTDPHASDRFIAYMTAEEYPVWRMGWNKTAQETGLTDTAHAAWQGRYKSMVESVDMATLIREERKVAEPLTAQKPYNYPVETVDTAPVGDLVAA